MENKINYPEGLEHDSFAPYNATEQDVDDNFVDDIDDVIGEIDDDELDY